MRILLLFLSLWSLPACTQEPPPAAERVCPLPADQVTLPGDANGDGAVNVADALLILHHAAAGGPAPACDAAVNLIPDSRVQLDDAFCLLGALAEDSFELDGVDVTACEDAAPLEPPDCADLHACIDAPASAAVGTFSAEVALASAGLDIEGWSLPLTASGCQIVAATTDGTRAAPTYADPPGLRDLGYDATFAHEGGASSVVILGFMQPTALPADGSPQAVLHLEVEATTCGTCTLTLGEPVVSLEAEIPAIVAAQGAAWPLPVQQTHITICP